MTFYVANQQELEAALSAAAAGGQTDIEITNSFSLINSNAIASGADVNITSSAANRQTLTRAYSGALFNVQNGATLTVKEIDIDGNSSNWGMSDFPLILNQGILNVEDAVLKNNSSRQSGGAIRNEAVGQLNIGLGVSFVNNHSDQNGGAICSHGHIMKLDASSFLNNTAIVNGGAIFDDTNVENLTINSCLFQSNSALNGGALYINNTAPDPSNYNVNGDSIFENNSATQNGGAIWINRLSTLFVAEPVIFRSNSAVQGYTIDPSDIPMHNMQILTRSFTSPFKYGYNNFDIYYTDGTPYVEEECDVVGSQTVDLCVPVTVTPSAVAGSISIRCFGPAVITPGTAICPGSPNPDCSFTISQRLCIEVPIEFSAEANVGETHVICDTAVTGANMCNQCVGEIEENVVEEAEDE